MSCSGLGMLRGIVIMCTYGYCRPGLMPPPALVVEEMGTERSGEHGSDVCGRGSEGTAAPVAVSRPLPTQTLRKLVRQHCGLGKVTPFSLPLVFFCCVVIGISITAADN